MTFPSRKTGPSRNTWIGAGCCTVVIAACLLLDSSNVFDAYLAAFLFCLGLSLGSLANLMLHEITGGRWGLQLRRPLLAASRLMPLNVLLFAPLLLGLPDLYPWARGETGSSFQSMWFSMPFFLARAAGYLGVWTLLAWRWSVLSERHSEARPPELRRLSAVGLILYGVTISLAAVDWIMSLMPRWHSTGFGLLIGTSQMLSGGALAVSIHSRSPAADASSLVDFGNLLLMYVMTAAYLAFTQFLIIWAEDLPDEIAWFIPRVQTEWQWLTLLVLVLNFAVPFFLLLSRSIKRNRSSLAPLASLLLLGQLFFCVYLVAPTTQPQGMRVSLGDAAITLAIVGLWAVGFLHVLSHSRDTMTAAANPAREQAR